MRALVVVAAKKPAVPLSSFAIALRAGYKSPTAFTAIPISHIFSGGDASLECGSIVWSSRVEIEAPE